MSHSLPTLSLFVIILLLGIRHGIDWDHIAAITDLTGSTSEKKQGFHYGTVYVFGHALVIFTLGLLAVTVGINLPPWIDSLMERIVGLTLILLGFFVLFSIARQGREFKMKSRWMVVFSLFRKLYRKIHNKLHHRHHDHDILHHPENYGLRSAFIIGMIHGIGAETPTQVLLFLTAAGASRNIVGILLVITFVLGLIISNSLITTLSVLGYANAKKNSTLYLALGLTTGVFSLIVGILFLFAKGSFLPAFFSG